MDRFAKVLALHYDANRTLHCYYRQWRLIHEHFETDPDLLTQDQLRDYFLFVKLEKHWKPKSIRQALAAARLSWVTPPRYLHRRRRSRSVLAVAGRCAW